MSLLRTTSAIATFVATVFLLSAGAGERDAKQPPTFTRLFAPLSTPAPLTDAISKERAALGKMLFFDKRLSKAGDVACVSCHDLSKYGVDGEPVSTGHKGLKGNRNAPTVFNTAGQVAQFWDGRAADLKEQAKGPVLNPVEMAMSSQSDVVGVLKAIAAYREAFHRAFPGETAPVTFDNMAAAIATYEERLVTPSRWDRYLKGEPTAITRQELTGVQTFVETGCTQCHAGEFVGGTSYQRLGRMKDWQKTSDPGRYSVTKRENDRYVFKVPSLRNIVRTGPYFHDGSLQSLDEAIRAMGEYQLGKQLTAAQVKSIATWLNTLTGDLPPETQSPVLPAGTL
jgi:cytochrome c peroxidase